MKSAALRFVFTTVFVSGCGGREITDDSAEGAESSDGGDSVDAGLDGEGADELGTAGDETGGTGGGDCPIGEYVEYPNISALPEWPSLSGVVRHDVTFSTLNPPSQSVDAFFLISEHVDDAQLCVETIVEPAGVDSCWVWYSQGSGLGGESPSYWYEDLPATAVTFDVGEGPIALESFAGGEFQPTSYWAELPAPPAGVPFGGTATLAATFDGLPDLGLALDVPNDLLPLGVAIDVGTLSSEGLASWTWTTPGGDAPVMLEISLGATPFGSGWTEWVELHCQAADDGAFAFPVEYLDLARERLGPELHAGVKIWREAEGSSDFAGKQVYWRSTVGAWFGVSVVD